MRRGFEQGKAGGAVLGRVASTYWESGAKSSTRRMSMRRGVGVSRAVDGIIITVILAAIAICVDLYFRSESEMASAVAKRQVAADRLDELNLRVYKMEREVESLRNDPAVIEQFARERFGYVRAGDVVVKMPMND